MSETHFKEHVAKKWLVFFFGFVSFWIVIGLINIVFFSDLLGDKKPELSEVKNPIQFSIELPTARFLTDFNSSPTDMSMPYGLLLSCVDSLDEAVTVVTEYYDSSSRFPANRFFVDEIQAADWQEYPEYFMVSFDRKVNGESALSMLRCDYFTQKQFLGLRTEIESKIGGYYGGNYDQESFSNLIWFLQVIGVVHTTGFNQSSSVNRIEITEDDNNITRTDYGTYTVCNDVGWGRCDTSELVTKYQLRKSDGAVLFSRQRQ